MKKTKDIIMGTVAIIFYFFVEHTMLFLLQYPNAVIIQGILFEVLLALPGAFLAFFLVRNSIKDFLKSWAICFVSSVCVIIIWLVLRVDLMIYTALTGFREFSNGEGILMVVSFFSYLRACTVGCIIAAIISFFRKKLRTEA